MMMRNISDKQKIYELSLIWKEAEYNFGMWGKLGGKLDWDKAYRDVLDAVLATENLYAYYRELSKFVALLRDGHTDVSFPEAIQTAPEYTAKLPILTRLIEGKRVITNVKASAAARVKRWSIIEKVDGIPLENYAKQHIYPYIWHEKLDSVDWRIDNLLRCGAEGSTVEFTLLFDGQSSTVTLERTKGDTSWAYEEPHLQAREAASGWGNVYEYDSDTHSIQMTPDGIAIITIPSMSDEGLPADFFASYPLLEKARGYVLDVRYNDGGSTHNEAPVAATFIGKNFPACIERFPIHIGTFKAWARFCNFSHDTWEEQLAFYQSQPEYCATMTKWHERQFKIPRREYSEIIKNPYDDDEYNIPGHLTAPLVVLVSPETCSAAEDFVIRLKYSGRATLIGTATYGSTGQPLSIQLESGGTVRICTKHCLLPNGDEFINVGVTPHIYCELSLEDIQNGIDTVMEKGLDEVRKMCKEVSL